MNTMELKNLLIARIQQINDFDFLNAIKTITDVQVDHANQPPVYKQQAGWYTQASSNKYKSDPDRKQNMADDFFDEMEQFLRDV